MSRIGKIARRSFLVGSVAIVGGVGFGLYKVRQPAANPLTPPEGAAAITPFVLIDAQGITLISPRAEMGQGVHTTWAALIAEELDVDMADVRVIHGPAAKAYYNSAVVGDALPGRDYDKSEFQHSVAEALGVLGKLISFQITGGSTSMKDGFTRMREAGAVARETLKLAAAEQLGVPVGQLRTAQGKVIAPDGTELPYTALAGAAAEITPPSAPALRDARDWRILGKSQPRVDMVAKSTGTAQFGIDVRLPDMRFAALRINPALGGTMQGYDDTAARAMPGVEKVVPLTNGVAVVACNTWLAQQAVDAIKVQWGASPNPPDTDAVFARIAAALDDAPNSTMRDDGDVATLPTGATLVEAAYRAPYLAHATMEPMNATAHFTGDALEVWCGNQTPVFQRNTCAKIAGLEPEAVTIHTTLMGGGFGRRGELDFASYATELAVAMPGVPVQLTWSRAEDMTHDFYRPGAVARFRGAVQNGKAVMVDGQIAAQSAVHQAMGRLAGLPAAGPDKVLVEGAFNQPYAIPNYRIRGHIAPLDIPVGFWRSVGNSFNGFFHDTFLDELAHAAGRDPLDFRLQMMRGEHAPSAGCLETVAQMSNWTGKTPEGVGRGVAFTYSFGTPVAQVVEVEQTEDGIRIARAWIACDMGIALDRSIVEAQMVGGMIYGLSAACFGEITFAEGRVEQQNFPDYDGLRIHNTPVTEVSVLETNAHMGGAGEPGTPPSMPALGNALFDLTGRRARSLPLMHDFDLLV
ncbi:xanthine dehydrogenase family protein molybdopterin-binding subunit [Arenibacterium halophilum]|uniref:Xanthine dehydrogenase family protein molybdopterin-binding subunit n=1 Tax=Arenibacterium halophilum TaxID=2583821 RepID=A0ABY2X8U4_9RHOB|nr:molybdopterin cofactor-binding domain-containing protein [Arenibacterium halophilum]TMV12797.1 xanthine dehydrogenase family protein molybdopterin-binding subunit [Arenibacterium halophilum]